MKPLILGVDPGSTSAIALVDFKGDLVHVESGKNFPPREMISKVVEQGKPVIVASDKEKFPSTVDKIARSFGAVKYELDEDLDAERKRELGEGDNSHEQDAVAASINAYRGLRDKIDKIEEISSERTEDKGTVALKYFRDNLRPPQQDDEEEASEEEERSRPVEPAPAVESLMGENQRLEGKVENLEEQVNDLKDKIEEQRDEASRWRSKYDRMRTEKRQEIMKERELSKKNAEIREKEDKISELEDSLEKSRIREDRYVKALKLIENGGKILPIFERTDERPEVSVTRSQDLKKELVESGERVFHVDDLEGVELLDRFVTEEEPEADLKKMMEEYRDAR
ncbi:DUF460 domain-containing protein [Candidatus Nanosalina sp. VS9-1]|uniref:DUF460 domain-containing protein n=1 Tax=Candidatus Nanosalina sp. VS9-1 TaxID=3388566 RepID=UPI0039E0D120